MLGNDTTKVVEEKCPFCCATHSTIGYQFGHKWICGTFRQRTGTVTRSVECRDSQVERLQARIDELEAIIRTAFVAWDMCGTNDMVLAPVNLSEETAAAIIEICKPRTEAAEPAEKETV